CRGSKHQKNGLAPLEERKRLCDPPNLPNLISFICLFPINMQPLAHFLQKKPGVCHQARDDVDVILNFIGAVFTAAWIGSFESIPNKLAVTTLSCWKRDKE